MREDIFGGSKLAVSKGETLQQAMMSFYNAGYKKEDIEEAAKVLQAQGAEVRVVAEGLSVAEWKSAGFDNCIVAEGPMDIKAPWEISPKDIFYNVQPDVVVCGLSSPIRSEFWFAAGANNKTCGGGAPLAILDDNWGATHRLSYQANLVLTCDELGKRLVDAGAEYCTFFIPIPFLGSRLCEIAMERGYLDPGFDPDIMNYKRPVLRNTVVPPGRILELRDWAWREVNNREHVARRLKESTGARWQDGAPAATS